MPVTELRRKSEPIRKIHTEREGGEKRIKKVRKK
jgi:hypothetical protein